ncbi:TIGR02530 family flagellar biosynthesis protein [Clostridium beijerinckii]|uniref:TIGR02530 family flagellar biosynthesis protein n=1 Tax=Clostridium beijerinckii TaxID=1520 RepID=UPI00156E14D9|nr:TIGR02530 family flagellar biosynthesis protein [Clostridium beijerinckii]NRT73668.1 flagellar operon protein [Clostridium beijerinckii]
MSYRIINGHAYSLGSIGQIQETQNYKNLSKDKVINDKNNSFKDVLNKVVNSNDKFTISKHAAQRLNEINFTDEDMLKVEEGFKKAEEKNSKNTVMIYKDTALIASIENRTIITAVNKDRAKDNIFTNIDSVVIL